MTTFFTADTHFNHANIIGYCNRPFSSIEEMNASLVANWNAKVKAGDTVYVLGDLGFFGSAKQALNTTTKLNGHIRLILGGHDKDIRRWWKQGKPLRMAEVSTNKLIDVEGHKVFLSHYAHRVWPCSHYGSFHLYGHSHGRLDDHGLSCDVGVDAWNFKPVEWAVPHGWLTMPAEEEDDES